MSNQSDTFSKLYLLVISTLTDMERVERDIALTFPLPQYDTTLLYIFGVLQIPWGGGVTPSRHE
jgi:hypothetical protein